MFIFFSYSRRLQHTMDWCSPYADDFPFPLGNYVFKEATSRFAHLETLSQDYELSLFRFVRDAKVRLREKMALLFPMVSRGQFFTQPCFRSRTTEKAKEGLLVVQVEPNFLNPCQSSPSSTIFVPLWFISTSIVFFYPCKLLFSDFLQFKGNFVRGQNNSKYVINVKCSYGLLTKC